MWTVGTLCENESTALDSCVTSLGSDGELLDEASLVEQLLRRRRIQTLGVELRARIRALNASTCRVEAHGTREAVVCGTWCFRLGIGTDCWHVRVIHFLALVVVWTLLVQWATSYCSYNVLRITCSPFPCNGVLLSLAIGCRQL